MMLLSSHASTDIAECHSHEGCLIEISISVEILNDGAEQPVFILEVGHHLATPHNLHDLAAIALLYDCLEQHPHGCCVFVDVDVVHVGLVGLVSEAKFEEGRHFG
jgi:hypothetical protein